MRRMFQWWVAAVVATLVVPTAAAASTAASAPTLVLPWQQLWPILIGAVVPLVTYVVNHVGPWLSEPAKAAVLIVASAVVSALYTALATNVFGLNAPTAQLVLTGVVGTLAAHHFVWKPSGVSTVLGGGSNRQQEIRPSAVKATPVTQPPAGPSKEPDAPQA